MYVTFCNLTISVGVTLEPCPPLAADKSPPLDQEHPDPMSLGSKAQSIRNITLHPSASVSPWGGGGGDPGTGVGRASGDAETRSAETRSAETRLSIGRAH